MARLGLSAALLLWALLQSWDHHVCDAHAFQYALTRSLVHSAGGRGSRDTELESEATAYQLLLLMTSGISRQEVLGPTQGALLRSRHVSDALRLHSAFAMRDGLAYLAILREAPHLLQCLAHQHAPAMRSIALEQLAEAFPPSRASLHPSQALCVCMCEREGGGGFCLSSVTVI